MALNLNKVILGGRLTSDPELKSTGGGTSVVSFGVAVNRRYKNANGQYDADFINVTAWRQTAEFIAKYFHKGSSICLCGALQTHAYTDKDGKKRYITEVVADEVSFVESRNPGESNYATSTENAVQTVLAPYTANDFEAVKDDDDVPF